MAEQDKKNQQSQLNKWRMVNLALELGFIIAIPLLVFSALGKWVDHRFNSFPWFTLAGIIIAIVSTTFWLVQRFKELIKKS